MAHLENKLRNLLEQIAAEQGFKNFDLNLYTVSSGGANYSSVLYKAKVEEKDKNDLNLFIKVAVATNQLREDCDLKIYEVERYVYKTMKRIFKQLEDKYNVAEDDRLVLPRYYGAHTTVREEMLVLEDLTARGFTTYDRLKSVDWTYASASVRELAKYHALVMAYQREYAEEYEKLVRDYNTEWLTEDVFNEFMKAGFDKALTAVREENREKLGKFFDKLNYKVFIGMIDPVKKAVLTHGDFRASNLMHRYRQDGSAEVIPIDYQTIRSGCVIVDLLYFIFTGSDEEFRRVHYKRLIDYYFDQLSAAMARLGIDSNYYSREDFDYELKEKLPYGLVVAAFSLPIVTIETDDAPKVENGLEMSNFATCKTSSLYSVRMNGVINDYVKWGILK